MNPKRAGIKIAFIGLMLLICDQNTFSQKRNAAKFDLADIERRIERSEFAGLDRQLMDFAIAHPNDAKALELLARLRFRQGRLTESKALYQRVLWLDPTSSSARINSARIAFVSDQKDDALLLLNEVNRGMSLNPTLRLELAAAYLLLGEAEIALSVALSLPLGVKNGTGLPLLGEIYLGLNRPEAVGALVPAMKIAAAKNAALAVRCADVLRGAGLVREAIELLTPISLPARTNVIVLLALSRLKVMSGDLQGARTHLLRAAKIEPRSAGVLSLQAHIESVTGNLDEALTLISRARDAEPSSPTVLADFVALTLRVGKPTLAYDAAKVLNDLVPGNPEYQYLLGVAALQSGNLESARASLELYVRARPNEFRSCLALGMVYAADRGQIARAQLQLARCNEIDPSNSEARYQLGLSYKSQGDNKRAIQLLEEAAVRAPKYAAALRDLGALYLESADDVKARTFLERAVALTPDDGDTHFQLARLYNRLGESALAKQHQETFQKLRGAWGKSSQ